MEVRLADSFIHLGNTQENFGVVVLGKSASVGGKIRRLKKFRFGLFPHT